MLYDQNWGLKLGPPLEIHPVLKILLFKDKQQGQSWVPNIVNF